MVSHRKLLLETNLFKFHTESENSVEPISKLELFEKIRFEKSEQEYAS